MFLVKIFILFLYVWCRVFVKYWIVFVLILYNKIFLILEFFLFFKNDFMVLIIIIVVFFMGKLKVFVYKVGIVIEL